MLAVKGMLSIKFYLLFVIYWCFFGGLNLDHMHIHSLKLKRVNSFQGRQVIENMAEP